MVRKVVFLANCLLNQNAKVAEFALLPDYGVYYSLVEKEMTSRGLEPPRLVIYRREEVGNRDLIVQRLSIPL